MTIIQAKGMLCRNIQEKGGNSVKGKSICEQFMLVKSLENIRTERTHISEIFKVMWKAVYNETGELEQVENYLLFYIGPSRSLSLF